MNLELIPVIELTYYNEKVETPNGSYYEFPKDWDIAHKENFVLAGFKDEFKIYESGMSFYKPNEITKPNLIRIIEIYFKEFELGSIITDDDIQPLDGGYILRDNNTNLIFPQCCGNLGDIESWNGIVNPNNNYFWNGHPTPKIIHKDERIIFDMSEFKQKEFSINREDLKIALIKTQNELNNFSYRINQLEQDYGITDLGNKLVFNQ